MIHKVESIRIKLLWEQGLLTQATGLINVCIFAFVAKDVVTRPVLLMWMGTAVTIFFMRFGVELWFRSVYLNKGREYTTGLWENIFCIGALLSGTNWAIASTVLLSSDMVVYQVFLGFVLAGTTAGAAVAYSSSYRAVAAFLLPALLPFAATLILNGDGIQHAMATMLILYTVLLMVLTVRVNSYLISSIRLAWEKDDLMNRLHASQSQTVYSQKMSALGTMASGVAHEINTPLSSINLFMDQLLRSSKNGSVNSQEIGDVATKVTAIVTRISKIISSLRTFARSSGRSDFEPVYMGTIISDTLALCESHFKSNGMSIVMPEIPPNAIFMGRSIQISQVLLNLLTNSLEALQGMANGWVKIEVQVDERLITLSVTDNGRGIKPELREKLMTPFFTTKEVGKGPGLGLTTALGIVKDHGGDLQLDTDCEWTRFVVTLEKIPGMQSLAAS
ncbi:MAG: GHKL domain-containing protein [Bdellovibrionales bacterium]|nr:GHKL domain-containing protein [Bdellovibrionales bacterium]